MDAHSDLDVLKELHGDLHRKYGMHAAAIERIWRSFDKNQRAACLKAGAAGGVVLEHSLDLSLGNVCNVLPEINLLDITEPESELLLGLLKHRATTTLCEQYFSGVNGGLGDLDFIEQMMRTRGLQHVEAFTDCHTMFFDDENYGESYEILSNQAEILSHITPAIQARQIIPQSTAELVLQRQTMLLQHLNIIVEDILDEGSQSREQKERPRKSGKAASSALSQLTFRAVPERPALSDLSASAQDQRADLEDYLGLLSSEPSVLAHAVNTWFFSQPELVADEKGRVFPAHTDKYISACFFEAIHSAIQGAAIWNYIGRLLELLSSSTLDKAYRAIVLQELSNTCHLEYRRAQSIFKRNVQTASGSKWFKRVSNMYDDVGNARVTMRGNPDLTRNNPQLEYMLRLCQPETNASRAIDWMKKLSDLHRAHPLEREKIVEREFDSLHDLAVVIGFTMDLSGVVSMPPFSRKSKLGFVSKQQELETELNQLKKPVDLRDFVVPIDNLLEPGIAATALRVLDEFVVEKAGTKMGLLYQDLVEDCLSNLQEHHQKLKTGLKDEGEIDSFPPPVAALQLGEQRVEQRKQKEKTRPPHSSAYEFSPVEGMPGTEIPTQSTQTFNVSFSTAEVFRTLFTKSVSRGSINWSAFEAAMSELGFSVIPKFGSVYTFSPPDTMAVKKSFTAHRPHQSKIEGRVIFIFAQRLRRVYGWGESTFEVS
ncbi:ipa protein [Cordyceps fumosorosea ARSEF 2679]|uniref:Ipa protein n=1 Tax=Cordyceps fumosorosea (strain ARSEF 2679) TaxID=1081104 RepID=A0A167F395_CORFA|nr:ipa protein [Cordyceps fumosorosea ARSEF 2679]OAA44734.1 ipa protein [Cordyceps fumosorosea ARSEF 2679]